MWKLRFLLYFKAYLIDFWWFLSTIECNHFQKKYLWNIFKILYLETFISRLGFVREWIRYMWIWENWKFWIINHHDNLMFRFSLQILLFEVSSNVVLHTTNTFFTRENPIRTSTFSLTLSSTNNSQFGVHFIWKWHKSKH